jgi:hypothetical protein
MSGKREAPCRGAASFARSIHVPAPVHVDGLAAEVWANPWANRLKVLVILRSDCRYRAGGTAWKLFSPK